MREKSATAVAGRRSNQSKALLFSAGGRYPYIAIAPGNCHRPPGLDKGAFILMLKKACEICGKMLMVYPSNYKRGRGRFCSTKCKGQWMSENLTGIDCPNWKGGPLARHCEICGTKFTAKPGEVKRGKGRFCSPECQKAWLSKSRTGEGHPNWQGGKSFEPYPTSFNKAFKRKIRERDNHICAICENPGECVHHIDYTKDNTAPENCITLCKSCHSKTNNNRDYWQLRLSGSL